MSASTTTTRGTLEYLLAKNHKHFDINYEEFKANHLVHGICTLFTLGASNERLEEFYDFYVKKLEPLRKPRFEINETNWENYIRDRSAYAELVVFFDIEVDKNGIEESLNKFLPILLTGLIGGAFHPLLHIGYGLEYNLPNVVAEGLAYATTYYYNVGEIINDIPRDEDSSIDSIDNPLDILLEMKQLNLTLPSTRYEAFPIDQILNVYKTEIIYLSTKWKLNGISSLSEVYEKLAQISRAIIIVTFGSYRNSKIDFFLMHNLTSLQSIRILLPYLGLSEQVRLLQLTLVGLLGNYWLQGMPTFSIERILNYQGESKFEWSRILDETLNCNDEHVMKVVRALKVIGDSPSSINPVDDESSMIEQAILMTIDFIKTESNWEFNGIGF